MRRLSLCDAGMGDGVILRLDVTTIEQLSCQPLDHFVVLGVHHHHRTLLTGAGEYVEHLTIVQTQAVVGHVHLERRIPIVDQRRQFFGDDLLGRVRDDEMERIVDHGFRSGQLVVRRDDVDERLAPMLRRERDDGRRSAEHRRHSARVEIVRAVHAARRLLLDVTVTVDTTRHHQLVGRVNHAIGIVERLGQRDDPAVANHHVIGRHRPGPLIVDLSSS